MVYFNNDYALPVILGGGKEAIEVAGLLKKQTGLEIHIFAQRLSLLNKLKYKLHRLISLRNDIILLSLNDFADSMQEYYTPILITTDSEGHELAEKNSSLLEGRYIMTTSTDVKKYFLKER